MKIAGKVLYQLKDIEVCEEASRVRKLFQKYPRGTERIGNGSSDSEAV